MDEPPPGNLRDTLTAHPRYAEDIRRTWDNIHGWWMMDAVLVRNAERMMLSPALTEEGIGLTFVDGCRGVVPFVDLPELGGPTDVHTLELPNPYEMILTTARGERVEFPWDRHCHCDRSHRPMVEAIALPGRRALGERVRHFRESAVLPSPRASGASPWTDWRMGSRRPCTGRLRESRSPRGDRCGTWSPPKS